MAHDYSPTPTLFTACPCPDDLDPRTVASVNAGLEALSDGVAYLNQKISAIVPVADLTALANILAPTDGQAQLVRNFGVYVFTHPSSYGTALNSDDVLASDATPGAWRRAGRTRRLLERSIVLRDYDAAYDPSPIVDATNTGLVTRDYGATFYPEARFYGQSGGGYPAIVLHQVAQVVSGGIVMQLSPGGATSKTYGLQWCVDDVLSQGATIFGAKFGVQPATGRGSFPSALLFSCGLFRCPRYPGSASTPSLTPLSSSYTGGFFQDTSASVADYETPHQLVYGANQNNVVDLESYTYYAQFWNEAGSGFTLPNNVVMNVTVIVSDYTEETPGGD